MANCDIKTKLTNTIKDEIKGAATSYKIEANRIFIPSYSASKFYSGLAQAFKIASTKVKNINAKYSRWSNGNVVSLDTSPRNGVYINVHPTQALIDAYEVEQERKLSGVDVVPQTLFTKSDKEKPSIIPMYEEVKKRLFKGEDIISSTELLNTIAKSISNPYIAKVADILTRFEHNPVPVKLVSLEQLEEYAKTNELKFYEGLDKESIGGFYSPKTNEILIVDKPKSNLEAVVIHEVIHALTSTFIKSDAKLAKEFERLFRATKSTFDEKDQKRYQFTNVDEFLTGILTDSKFQSLLMTKKSPFKVYTNKWSEIKNFIIDILTKYLNFTYPERTLFDHLMDKSFDLIEAANTEQDELKELNQSSWEEYAYTGLSNEDKDDIKESTKKYAESIKNTLSKEQVDKRIAWFFKQFDVNLKSLTKSKEFKEQRELYTDELTGSNTYVELTRRLKNVSSETNYDLKVRAMAEAISTTRKLVDITFDNVKKIAVDNTNAKENVKTLYNYTRLLNSYEKSLESVRNLGDDSPHEMFSEIVDSLDKIQRIRNFIVKNDTTGIIQLIKENALTSTERYKSGIVDTLKKQHEILKRAEAKKDYERVKATKEQIKDLENQIKKYDLQNEATISNWLKGKYGDQNRFSMLLDSYRDSTDPIIGTFANYVNSLKQQVKKYMTQQRTIMDKELEPHYKTLGYGKVDYERLWGQLTFADDRIDENGEKTKVLTFLNPYKNYQYERDLFNKQISDLRTKRDNGDVIDKESMTDELLTKVEILEEQIKNKIDIEANSAKWDKLTKPYNIQEQLKTKYLERALWESKYMVRDKTDAYYNVYDNLYNDEIGIELKEKREEIFSKLNVYNSLQEEGILSEEDKSEQDVLWNEYYALSNLYQKNGEQKTGIELDIAKRSQEIAQANRDHYDYHINDKAFERDKNSKSEKLIAQYGEDSDEYKTQMDQWLKDNTRQSIKAEYYIEREKVVNTLNDLLDLLPNSDVKAEKLGEYYKEIIGQVYGARDDNGQPIGDEISEERSARIKFLQEEIEKIKKSFKLFSGLEDADSTRLSELYNLKAHGLSTDEWNEYQELVQKSKDLGVPADLKARIISLFEQLKDMSSRIATPYYINAFNTASDIKIEEDGKLDGIDILDSPRLDELMENTEFKEWFDKNHFKTEVYDPEIQEKVMKWQRLYQWSKVIPTNPDMIETLPARSYTYRVIKPEFKTKEIVGITTDNKGNFLPRLDAKDKKYINQDYFRLQSNRKDPKNNALYSILEVAKRHHLLNQDLSNNYNNKLWMDVPRIRKEAIERNIVAAKNPVEFVKDIPGRIKSKYQSLEEYSSGTGNAPVEDTSEDDLDFLETKISNRRSTIPVAYMTKMDINDVSRDIRRSVLDYGGSLKSSEVLKEALPFAEALREIFKSTPIETNSLFKFKETTNVRLDALEYYINREFFGVGKRYELGKGGDRFFTAIKSLSVLKFLGSNVSSILTNLADGLTQNMVNAGHGRFSRKDYIKSYKLFSEITGNAFKDFFNEELGKYSVSTQLLEAFEPVSDKDLEDHLTTGKSKLRYALSLDYVTGNRAKTEYYIQTRVYAAYMYATKVAQGQKTISLSDAYEIGPNGVARLKDGIDKEWDIYTGTKFIQLKNDIQKSIRDLQGAYAKADRTFLDQYTLFSFLVTLKRFFFRKAVNQFGTSGVSFNWKSGINFKPRFNANSGSDLGFALSMINGLSKVFIQDKSFNFDLMTKQEKADTLRFMSQIGTIIILSILAFGLYGGGDQKDKFRQIDNLSDSQAYLLYQTLRLKTETETLLSPSQYYTFITDVTAGSIFLDWKNLIKDVTSQDVYKKDTGINKKGDKKWVKDVEQLTGIYSILKLQKPKDMAKNYEKALNSKAK